eukprot:137311_1
MSFHKEHTATHMKRYSVSHLTNGFYTKYQAYSGLAFSTFSLLHLFNHAMVSIGGSMQLNTKFLNLFRKYYRQPVIEVGLGVALLVHMYCNVQKIRQRSRVFPKSLSSRTFHRYSGFVLSSIIIGHILALRVMPQIVVGYDQMNELDNRIISADLQLKPIIFYPFLFALYVNGMYHTLYGLCTSFTIIFKGKQSKLLTNDILWTGIGVFSLFVAGLSLAGYGGHFYEIDIPWDTIHPVLTYIGLK